MIPETVDNTAYMLPILTLLPKAEPIAEKGFLDGRI